MFATAATDKPTAILAATLDLVAERGFHGTPIALIAKRSGVSAGIIYHYFDNKDDLIQALYQHIKAELAIALLAGTPQDMPWPENIERIWLNAYRFYVQHPKATHFLEQYENSPFPHDWDMTQYHANFGVLADLMQASFAAGVMQPLPFPVIYELTLGVAVGMAKRQIAGEIALDETLLHRIATACRRAVEA